MTFPSFVEPKLAYYFILLWKTYAIKTSEMLKICSVYIMPHTIRRLVLRYPSVVIVFQTKCI